MPERGTAAHSNSQRWTWIQVHPIPTYAAVSGKPGQDVIIILPDGKQLKGKSLGRNGMPNALGSMDSGLVKITDEGKYPFLEMGKSSELKPGQWVIAIGHPGGFRPNRTPVVRVGRILFANAFSSSL